MKNFLLCCCIFFLLSAFAHGQGVLMQLPPVVSSQGQPIPGATITVYTATASGNPPTFSCNTPVTVYADVALSNPITTLKTDGFGNFPFFIAPSATPYGYTVTGSNSNTALCYGFTVTVPNGSSPTFTGLTVNGTSALNGNTTVTGNEVVTGTLTVGLGSTGLSKIDSVFNNVIQVGLSTYPCTTAGITAALAIVPATGQPMNMQNCAAAVNLTGTINWNVPVTVYLGATTFTCTGFAGDCWRIASPSVYLHGMAPGHPQNSDAAQSTKIVAGAGYTGALVKQLINAGARDGMLDNVTIDCNSRTASVNGLEIGPSQDNRSYYDHIAITGCIEAILTDSDSTHSVQDLHFNDIHIQFSDFGFDFGQAAINGVLVTNSRVGGANIRAWIAGSDDNTAANTSFSIRCVQCDLETQPNSTTCIQPVLFRNCNNCGLDGYWVEQGTGATCSAQDAIQLGTASATSIVPFIKNIHGNLNSNATTTHPIGLVNVQQADIQTNQFQGCSGTFVRNAAGTSGSKVVNNAGCASGIPVDVLTGLLEVDGNSTIASNAKLFPMGIKNNSYNELSGASVVDMDIQNGVYRMCRNSATSCAFQVNAFNTLNPAFKATATIAQGLAFGSFTGTGPNVANCVFCLASGEQVAWRNAANSGDDILAKDGSDRLTYRGQTVNDGAHANPEVIASGTATMTTAAITAGNCGTTVTVAASGVATTDTITWSFNAAPAGSDAGLVSWPTANNVNFAYCPNLAETPAAATINWRVMR